MFALTNNRDDYRILFAALLLTLVLSILGLSLNSVQAQTSSPQESVSGLTDKEVRAILIDRMAADRESLTSTTDPFNPAIIVYQAQQSFAAIRQELGAITGAVVELPGVLPRAWQRLTDNRSGRSFGAFLVAVVISLSAGVLVELAGWTKTRKTVAQTLTTTPTETADKAAKLGLLAAIGTARVTLFAIASAALYMMVFDDSSDDAGQDRVTFFFYLVALVIFRLALVASNSFYAADTPALRLPRLSDHDALFFHKTGVSTVALGAFGFFTCALFGTLGISGHVHSLLLVIVGTLTCTGLVLTNIKGRQAISHDLCAGLEDRPFRCVVSHIVPWFNAAAILIIWVGLVIAELSDLYVHYGAALLTFAALFVLPSVDAILEREAVRQFDNKNDIMATILRSVRIGGGFLAALIILQSWGVDPVSWAGQGLGAGLARGVLQSGLVILFTYIIWQTVRITIDRKNAEEDEAAGENGHEEEAEIGGAGLSRIRTLLPLLKRTLQITLFSISGMIVLASTGIDIAPVLAGAGVVGLAIGFGSQTLVRDIVSGVFFLVDDAFRLGEYIDVGEAKGAVEKMSIRSLRLRHHRGAIHTIPFGEIKTLSNYSRDWVIMKLKFRVPFDTDVKKVKRIFKAIGQELLENPEIADDFIQPFKSQGVLEVDDYGLVIRAKFTAKPGRQFMIRKEAFVAVQQAFEENGIEFAKPVIRVAVEDDDDETSPGSSKVIAGAAASAALAPAAT